MKLIVGLGNPDKKYLKTRHNFGYLVVDSLARTEGLSWRYMADFICYFIKAKDYLVVKPAAYMNKSGESVKKVCEFYKIATRDILVVYDELDLPFGKIRLSFDGVSAGHKGVESAIASLGSVDFARLRMGIGKLEQSEKSKIGGDGTDYVLADFSDDEKVALDLVINKGVQAARAFIAEGIDATMNRFN